MATTAPRDGRAPDEDWSPARRIELASQIASARLTVEEACARHGLDTELVQAWLHAFRRSVVSAFDARLKRTLAEQGANVALGAAEFAGTLEEISVIDWVQSVEVTRKSAVIIVTHEPIHNASESRIWCADGAIIDAESGRLRGEAALYRIVSFEHGRVLVEFGAAQRARTIAASTPSLLLEAAHRKDEAARLWGKLGDGRRAYRVSDRARSSTAPPPSSAERRLLGLFQQPISLLQVLEQSELGDVETLTLLAQLSESQLIAADPSSTRAAPPAGDPGDLSASSHTLTTLERVSAQRRFPRWILPGWAWSGLAVLALATAAALARFEPAANAPEPALTQSTHELLPARSPAAAPTYVVATKFYPPDAALSLDGQRLPSSALNATFPKDGQAHELRAVAPGYAPAVVVFADTPPPRVIRLETLPVAPGSVPLEAQAPVETRAAAAAPARGGAEGAGPETKRRPGARRRQRARPAEPATKPPETETIDATTPAIRVIP